MKKYFFPILAILLAGCQQTVSNNDQLMTTNELLGEWQCVGNNMETDRTVEIYHFKENGAFEYEGEVNRLDILVYGIQAKGIWTLANNKLTVISQSGNVEKRHPKKVLAELRKNKTLSNRENALSEALTESLNSQIPTSSEIIGKGKDPKLQRDFFIFRKQEGEHKFISACTRTS